MSPHSTTPMVSVDTILVGFLMVITACLFTLMIIFSIEDTTPVGRYVCDRSQGNITGGFYHDNCRVENTNG